MSYSNDEIINGIRNKDDGVFQFIYNSCYPDIRRLVLHNSGSEEDVEDLFHDSLLISYNKLSMSGLKLKCSFRTYLYSVARLLWMKELRSRRRKDQQVYNDPDSHPGGIKNSIEKLEAAKMKIYEKHFRELSKECQKVLFMYFENASMEEICDEMGYKNVQIAKDKKYRCKKSLITRIANNPEYKKVSDEVYLVS